MHFGSDSEHDHDLYITVAMPSNGPQTFQLFCYGTLMLPAILKRVIGRKGQDLLFQDAVVEGYTRHHVREADYPALIEAGKMDTKDGADKSTRGTLISGLSEQDMKLLDIFEGDEYERAHIFVNTTSEPESMDVYRPGKTTNDSGSTTAAVYLWTASVARLEPKPWSFDEFVRDKSSRWATADSEYAEVDAARSEPASEELEGRTMEGFPDFGHNMKKYWPFAPTYVNLNHGSYGSPPLCVIEAREKLSRTMDSRIDLWIRRKYEIELKKIREQLAPMIGAQTDEVVIVPNTSHGVNTIAWNMDWADGDVIVVYASTYGAVSQLMKHMCDRHPKVRLEVILVTFPCLHADIVAKTEAVLKRLNKPNPRKGDDIAKAIGVNDTERVRMLVIDSIASVPGVLYPWQEVVKLCTEYGVLSLVDAAHSIGQHKVDVKKADPDFLVTNCHKWLMTHRGSALMYIPLRNQRMVRSSFPTSHSYESERYPIEGYSHPWKFISQYNWNGTNDFTPVLTIPVALQFRKDIGGEDRIMAYNHSVAVAGGKRLAKRWNTSLLENEKNELTVNMVNIRLPLPIPKDGEEMMKMSRFIEDVLLENDTFASPYMHDGHWWARFSGQVWVEVADFDYVADVYDEINARIRKGEHLQWKKNPEDWAIDV